MATIELENAPLFMIPGKVHLTVESPGPIEIDPTLFSAEERKWINNAHSLRKVKVVNPDGPVSAAPTQIPAPTPATEQQAIMNKDKDSEIEKVKKMLKLPINSLKKMLNESDDIHLLRLVKAQEDLKTKPRKSLLKVVDARLGRINDIVAKKVGGEDVGGKLNPVQVQPVNSEFVSEVTDEAEKEIIIRPATEDDYSDDLEVTDE